MNLGLKERAALVCGASKGLGKAVALGLAREGARLAICSCSLENIQQAAKEIREAAGTEVLPLPDMQARKFGRIWWFFKLRKGPVISPGPRFRWVGGITGG